MNFVAISYSTQLHTICEQIPLLIAYCHLFSQPHGPQDNCTASLSGLPLISFQYQQIGQDSSR